MSVAAVTIVATTAIEDNSAQIFILKRNSSYDFICLCLSRNHPTPYLAFIQIPIRVEFKIGAVGTGKD